MGRWISAGAVLRAVGAASWAMCILSGCGGESGYDISGTVTFDGKPIPAGMIYFTPDSSKGNRGPTGYAPIENGKYDTAAAGGRATPGGAMIVGIEGHDPSAPAPQEKGDTSGEQTVKALFPRYETAAELPKEDTTQDFSVPAEAARPKPLPERRLITP